MKKLFFIVPVLAIAALAIVCGESMATKASSEQYIKEATVSDSEPVDLKTTSLDYFDLKTFFDEHNITVLNHGAYWEGISELPAELYCETEKGYRFRIISYGDSTPVFAWNYDDTDEGFYEIDFTDAGDRYGRTISTNYENITLGEKSVETLIQIAKRMPELQKGICPFSQTGVLHFAIYDGDFIGHDQTDTPTYDYDFYFD